MKKSNPCLFLADTDCSVDGDCKNGGTCNVGNKCVCAPGFNGVFCDERGTVKIIMIQISTSVVQLVAKMEQKKTKTAIADVSPAKV